MQLYLKQDAKSRDILNPGILTGGGGGGEKKKKKFKKNNVNSTPMFWFLLSDGSAPGVRSGGRAEL